MDAELYLEFSKKGDATTFRCVRQEPPWKVIRGFTQDGGESLVHLNNVSGGIFGGDHLSLSVHLAEDAQAQITTTGATRLYRPRPQAMDAMLTADFHLGRGSILEYLPDALIPFRQAKAMQKTSYFLDEGATLFYWETIAPGRSASGERFEYERLKLATEISVCGESILTDRMLLEPSPFPPASRSMFGSHAYLVTFAALRAGALSADIAHLEECLLSVVRDPGGGDDGQTAYWGVTRLPAHGVMVRGLLTSHIRIPAMLHSLWGVAKMELCKRAAVAPRKTY